LAGKIKWGGNPKEKCGASCPSSWDKEGTRKGENEGERLALPDPLSQSAKYKTLELSGRRKRGEGGRGNKALT